MRSFKCSAVGPRSRRVAFVIVVAIAIYGSRPGHCAFAQQSAVSSGIGSAGMSHGVVKSPEQYDGKVQALPEGTNDPIASSVDPEALEEMKRNPQIESIAPVQQQEDLAAPAGAIVNLFSPASSFLGLGFDNAIPPDNGFAAGLDYLVQAVNFRWQVLSKSGAPVTNLTNFCGSGGWWSTVLPAGTFNCTDPRVLYDQYSDRWILLALAIDQIDHKAYQLLSTSFGSSPAGSWCLAALDATMDGSNQTSNWGDFPGLGVDNQAIYITTNQVPFGANSASYAKLRILGKSQFYNNLCGAVSWRDFWGMHNPDGTTVFTLQPAHTYGSPGVEYLLDVNATGSNTIAVWTLANPLSSSPTLSAASAGIQSFNLGPNAQQCANAAPLNTFDARLASTAFMNGNLWTAHTVACPTDSSKSCVHVLEVNPAGVPVVAFDSFYGSAAAGWNYFYPATIADPAGNLYLVFGRSRSNADTTSGCAEARFAGKSSNEAQIENSLQLQNGASSYVQVDSLGRNRWGDYSGIALDPSDSTSVWVSGEFVSSQNTWGNWIARMQISQSPQCFVLTEGHSGSGGDPAASPANSSGCAAGQYQAGEQIQLTALPAAGWQVSGWSGTNNDGTIAAVNFLTMPSASHAITVFYAPTCFALSVGHSGSGGDPVASPTNSSGCAVGQYQAGEQIQLTASPAPNWQVSGWSGTNNDASTSSLNSLTMPSTSHAVAVSYSMTPTLCFILTTSHIGSGGSPVASPPSSSGCAAGQYHSGDQIQLAASPAGGWQVIGWSGTDDDASTSASNSLTMPAANRTVSVQYSPTTRGGFFTVTPCRALDTRSGAGPLSSGIVYNVQLAGICSVSSTAKSVAVNVTVFQGTGAGFIVLWPSDLTAPGTSTLNFTQGRTLANNAVVGLATNGAGELSVQGSLVNGGTFHLLIDVTGYFD